MVDGAPEMAAPPVEHQNPPDNDPPQNPPPPEAENQDPDDNQQDPVNNEEQEDTAPDDWATLLSEADLSPFSIAQELADANHDASWEDMTAPFAAWTNTTSVATYDPGNAMFSFTDTPASNYFLIVRGDQVNVMFGLRRCHPLSDGGSVVAALIGDRELRGGAIVHPSLFRLNGQANTQSSLFEAVSKRPMGTDAITNALNQNEEIMFTQQLPDPAVSVNGWRALPIHPKLACLFFKGLTVREAFLLTERIVSMMPESVRPNATIWRDTMHVAAVAAASTGAGLYRSSLSKTWNRVDHLTNSATTDWYYALIDAIAKVQTPASPPAGLPGIPPSRTPGQLGRSPGPHGRTVTFASPASVAGFPDEAKEFFEGLADKVSAPREPSAKSTKRYEWHEMTYIFKWSGATTNEGDNPYSGLSHESLPQFFQELESMRSDKSNTRGFIENYRTEHYPATKTQYQFILTSQLIKDIKSLSLAGDDPQCTFDNRFRGLGVFSLAPLSEASLDTKTREQMLIYELTSANHSPADAAAMAKLSALAQSIPSTRPETYSWVDHVHIMTSQWLGERCPLNDYHILMIDALSLVAEFAYWTADDWRAFIWAWHRAYRAFMNRCTTVPIKSLTSILQAGGKVDQSVMPPQMRAATRKLNEPNDKNKRKGTETEGPPNPNKKKEASIAAHFTNAIQAARPKTKSIIRAGLLLPDEATTRDVLGAEFMSMLPAGKEPCTRHFIFGRCSGCARAHTLSRKPTQAMLDGILQRVKARLDTIIQENPK